MSAHRVVIVGGLQATRGLQGAPVEITLIDRRNFHRFQPLSDEVATGALSRGEVAYPLPAVFNRNRNVRVRLAEVDRFDLERREVVLGSVGGRPALEPVPYDTLIVAGGSHYSYSGKDDWNAHPAEVKSLECDRDLGETQIVVADIRDESLLVFPVPGANAGEAFRHPFRYAQ